MTGLAQMPELGPYFQKLPLPHSEHLIPCHLTQHACMHHSKNGPFCQMYSIMQGYSLIESLHVPMLTTRNPNLSHPSHLCEVF